MSIQQEMLKVLAENLKSRYPQLVTSQEIALKMGINETVIRQVLRSMKGLGVIESDLEGHYVLITPKGLSRVKSLRYH